MIDDRGAEGCQELWAIVNSIDFQYLQGRAAGDEVIDCF